MNDQSRETPTQIRRDLPLVPADTIVGRSLIVVVAIMTFLASLTAAGGFLVNQASRGWQSDVARDLTIQIKPGENVDADAEAAKVAEAARAAPNVAEVHPYGRAESEKMLEPWLGRDFDLGQLPIPRLIVVRMAPGHENDLEPLRAAIAAVSPQATLDDQRVWAARLDATADAVVAFAIALFALMLVAMATAVGFATRGAVASTREIVEVLHLVGASDGFIARQFQSHFLRLGFIGAAYGAGAAAALFGLAWAFSLGRTQAYGADEVSALFGAFALGWDGYAAIAAIGVGVGLATGLLSRQIVLRHLASLR